MFRNIGANAFAKNQMRLAYEDKRDLYCRTGMEDSEWEDIGDRDNRSNGMSNIYNYSEEMTPRTYTPPPPPPKEETRPEVCNS